MKSRHVAFVMKVTLLVGIQGKHRHVRSIKKSKQKEPQLLWLFLLVSSSPYKGLSCINCLVRSIASVKPSC
ncbi:hypothetical protein FLL79_05530 [Vibrio cholerae]|nr:hypothetical protein FLL79_05530 [Vibrio cholerae]